jgi:hypothetical protein
LAGLDPVVNRLTLYTDDGLVNPNRYELHCSVFTLRGRPPLKLFRMSDMLR